jgi:hypothetical protein
MGFRKATQRPPYHKEPIDFGEVAGELFHSLRGGEHHGGREN